MTTAEPVRPLCDPIPLDWRDLCPELSPKSGADREDTKTWWAGQRQRIRARLGLGVDRDPL